MSRHWILAKTLRGVGIVATMAMLYSTSLLPMMGPSIAWAEKANSSVKVKCMQASPQAPRDVMSAIGTNPTTFDKAPPAAEMTLCNIH